MPKISSVEINHSEELGALKMLWVFSFSIAALVVLNLHSICLTHVALKEKTIRLDSIKLFNFPLSYALISIATESKGAEIPFYIKVICTAIISSVTFTKWY